MKRVTVPKGVCRQRWEGQTTQGRRFHEIRNPLDRSKKIGNLPSIVCVALVLPTMNLMSRQRVAGLKKGSVPAGRVQNTTGQALYGRYFPFHWLHLLMLVLSFRSCGSFVVVSVLPSSMPKNVMVPSRLTPDPMAHCTSLQMVGIDLGSVVTSGSANPPWAEPQRRALAENVGKYSLFLQDDKGQTPVKAIRWYSMAREVPELAGYPVTFLREMYSDQVSTSREATGRKANESASDTTEGKMTVPNTVPSILPFLDEYDFTSTGGMTGRVYGMDGIIDGSTIQTSPVVEVQDTLPLGYVRTLDRITVYELGSTRQDKPAYSLDPAKRILSSSTDLIEAGVDRIGKSSTALTTNNDDLVKLAATTGLLLTSAAAVGMLSHHLTVNVFWV